MYHHTKLFGWYQACCLSMLEVMKLPYLDHQAKGKCEHHRLVAAEDDIWLMLSFQDTLNEMHQYPAVNSFPQERFRKLCLNIEAILSRFKEIDSKNYSLAEEKHKEACHPLYSTLNSLNDLVEVFSWS